MSEQMQSSGGYSVFHGTMADMTYPEVDEAAKKGAAVLWGLGVMEQHGPHLPLATDVYMPYALLRRVREELSAKDIESVIMPPFYYGVNHVTGMFPGSFEVRPEIMVELMVDLIKSLRKDGFKDLFCVSGHGDALHNQTILEGVTRGGREAGINTYFVGAPSFIKRLGLDPADPHVLVTASEVEKPSKFLDVHAGEFETSTMLSLFPEVVRSEIMLKLKSTDFTIEDLMEWRKGREHALRKTPHGYLGDPARSDPVMGGQLMLSQAALVADAIATRLKG